MGCSLLNWKNRLLELELDQERTVNTEMSDQSASLCQYVSKITKYCKLNIKCLKVDGLFSLNLQYMALY